jgi:hypothetical protein
MSEFLSFGDDSVRIAESVRDLIKILKDELTDDKLEDRLCDGPCWLLCWMITFGKATASLKIISEYLSNYVSFIKNLENSTSSNFLTIITRIML